GCRRPGSRSTPSAAATVVSPCCPVSGPTSP
ncbi:MAG: Transcriptional regulator, DeoR family, partial [uncultured Pseudonocardia sp.]